MRHLEASLSFYVDTLGFTTEYRRDEEKFAFLSLQGSQIMLEECNGHWDTGHLEYPFGRGINFQICVEGITPLLSALADRNYPLMKSPWEAWYRKGNESIGQREFLVQDPDGYLLRFSESLGTRPLGK